MSSRFLCVVVVGLLSLTGCGATVRPVTGSPDGSTDPDAALPDVASPDVASPDVPWTDVVSPDVPLPGTCVATSQCRAGEECFGGAGCGVPWTCVPILGRTCTDDLAPFCGCDGVTFYGSSACPTRPYDHRGPCEMPPPPPDGGPPPACTLPDGALCPLGATCPWQCNVCQCSAAGLRCTTRGCVDGGPPPPPRMCARASDCGAGEACTGAAGCGTPWFCAPVTGCTPDLATFCGCDGVTFTGSSTCPGRPYAHFGACGTVPPDAGPLGCALPHGELCPVGTVCSVDRCTSCFCAADGTLACTTNPACLDGGVRDGGVPDVTRRCSAQVDCAASETCQGAPGCGTPWFCAPSPGCTRDLVTYCGCDGRTFTASSTCPGRPYAARGSCSAPPPPDCAAQDAVGSGGCTLFLGYVWNGSSCVGIGGCSCVGRDCAARTLDRSACEAAHAACPRDAGAPPPVDF